jgi:hypothetical protein
MDFMKQWSMLFCAFVLCAEENLEKRPILEEKKKRLLEKVFYLPNYFLIYCAI